VANWLPVENREGRRASAREKEVGWRNKPNSIGKVERTQEYGLWNSMTTAEQLSAGSQVK
jgi:hypothetical protein